MAEKPLHRALGAISLALCLCAGNALGEPAAQSSGATSTSTVERCVSLHEQARLQRVQEQWLEARESMKACAAQACPLALRVDCQDWLEELSLALPSLLVVVEGTENDAARPRLELDGRELTLPEPLGPIEVLPGKHQLRASAPGFTPIDVDITLAKGEKNRVIHVRLTRPAEAPGPRTATPEAAAKLPSPHPTETQSRRPIPAVTYLFSGGALAAFTTSGILLGTALSKLSTARDTCAPFCDASKRRDIDRRLLAADIVGGVGLALTGAAIYTFLKRPTQAETPVTAPSVAVSPSSVTFSFESRF